MQFRVYTMTIGFCSLWGRGLRVRTERSERGGSVVKAGHARVGDVSAVASTLKMDGVHLTEKEKVAFVWRHVEKEPPQSGKRDHRNKSLDHRRWSKIEDQGCGKLEGD